ncbi:MAG: 4-alpha-glucanotransferase [Oscillospiraceae bacterium]|nr:4-alpha-glucanotransferase [Oscillospiraceae bacterium]
MRSAGILLHLTSLPSPYGIGTMGKAAYDFAEFLHAAGQHYWQLLPIGPTSYGDSPYQCVSTFAGNPYLIDLDLLAQEGLLTPQELKDLPNPERVDYSLLYEQRYPLLYKAFLRGSKPLAREITAFRQENPWVEDYALFMAVKRTRSMACWAQWQEDIRLRRPDAIEACTAAYREDLEFFVFLQYLFDRQWKALRDFVHRLGIELIGDLPIYVPYDSCEVWTQSELFQLDREKRPTAVAGCPPDLFSAEGQLWGNPLYRWDAMAQDDFLWWRQRIAGASSRFDVIRIDHFRGLESYWSVPYGEPTARNGQWIKGPGKDFTDCLKKHFPTLRFIAEDLGYLTPEVLQLRQDFGYPGMKILEFAFDPREPGNYLPHRYHSNCVCYSGTHDNETLAQWLEGLAPEGVQHAMAYLNVRDPAELPEALLRCGLSSVADTFIAQMQDYLGLGAQSRMNTPGILSPNNWSWRMSAEALRPELAQELRRLVTLYER